jgi:mRNA-degrading endonuclease RelE of RelBE toxin-antitoxin system
MRTTVDIDDPILKDLKKIQQKEGKSLGRLISDLLAQAIGERKSAKGRTRPAKWISKSMGARIDLADHEALYAAMEREPQPKEGAE